MIELDDSSERGGVAALREIPCGSWELVCLAERSDRFGAAAAGSAPLVPMIHAIRLPRLAQNPSLAWTSKTTSFRGIDQMVHELSELTDYERRYVGMLDELSRAPEVEVLHEQRGPVEREVGDAAATLTLIAEEFPGVALDPTLDRCFLRFEAVSGHWGIERGDMYLTGEFSVRHLGAAMFATAEDLETEESTEFEAQLCEELRPFDEHPKGGGGTLAGLRIQPGVASPQVWFYNGTSSFYQLDLDYCEYLDALLVTKGTYGWQYLFADVDGRNMDFQFAAEGLRNMLRVFPEIFPDYDYEPFQARLAERLR
ncbi:hypothetical protein [Saccharopolyspora sp. 5N708]|uniref:hypothetical protein n=1 Tax=Saccharopolyspora sp. 5N708 TaxID=3457424 RepID=UPI003FD2AB69